VLGDPAAAVVAAARLDHVRAQACVEAELGRRREALDVADVSATLNALIQPKPGAVPNSGMWCRRLEGAGLQQPREGNRQSTAARDQSGDDDERSLTQTSANPHIAGRRFDHEARDCHRTTAPASSGGARHVPRPTTERSRAPRGGSRAIATADGPTTPPGCATRPRINRGGTAGPQRRARRLSAPVLTTRITFGRRSARHEPERRQEGFPMVGPHPSIAIARGHKRARRVSVGACLGRPAGAQGETPASREGVVSAHRIERPFAARLDEQEQSGLPLPSCMERGSGGATAAFHGCRSEVGADREPADDWSSSAAKASLSTIDSLAPAGIR
jgi:hypothetical protein